MVALTFKTAWLQKTSEAVKSTLVRTTRSSIRSRIYSISISYNPHHLDNLTTPKNQVPIKYPVSIFWYLDNYINNIDIKKNIIQNIHSCVITEYHKVQSRSVPAWVTLSALLPMVWFCYYYSACCSFMLVFVIGGISAGCDTNELLFKQPTVLRILNLLIRK